MGDDLLNLVRSIDQQIASLFGQLISINFAMIAAIYYFLNRSKLSFKLFAFLFYGVGMIVYLGLMLREANLKLAALEAIDRIPQPLRSSMADALSQLSKSWLFVGAGVFMNVAWWAMWVSIAYLLFVWRKPEHAQG